MTQRAIFISYVILFTSLCSILFVIERKFNTSFKSSCCRAPYREIVSVDNSVRYWCIDCKKWCQIGEYYGIQR